MHRYHFVSGYTAKVAGVLGFGVMEVGLMVEGGAGFVRLGLEQPVAMYHVVSDAAKVAGAAAAEGGGLLWLWHQHRLHAAVLAACAQQREFLCPSPHVTYMA
jgi:hypothetical protein